jgi:uncharacterized protein YbjT (DUF2867 family)
MAAVPIVFAGMPRILVIGGTGTIGSQVTKQLAAAGADVRAMVRNPGAAHFPSQVELVRGDLTVPGTVDPCLNGIDAVFLVWTAPPDTIEPVLERIARHAKRIVFLSAPYKTAHPMVQAGQPNPMTALLARIERQIAESGMEWTILRPGMFAANARHWWGPQIRAGDVVRWPYLDVSTSPVDERDIAAVAVHALGDHGHAGAEYVLTGPQELTQRQQIETIARAIGRELRIEEMTPDEVRRLWAATWPEPAINMLLTAWGASVGHPAFITSTVAEVLGTPARTFQQWAADHTAEFQAWPHTPVARVSCERRNQAYAHDAESVDSRGDRECRGESRYLGFDG